MLTQYGGSRRHEAHGSQALGLARAVVLAGLVSLGALEREASAAFPKLKLEVVSQNQLATPIGMATAHDGSNRLFVVDQRGKIQIMNNGAVNPTPFLDLSSKIVPQRTNASGQPTFDERGLLGLTFNPDYAKPGTDGYGKFYAFYSAPSPDAPGTPSNPVNARSVISEFRVDPANPNQADPTYERVLMSFNKPQFNHNGGQIAFGPDRMLYISTGDGGGADDNDAGHTGGSAAKPSGVLGNAQDRTNLLGKILRIDPLGSNAPGGQYGIPSDNPFVGTGAGVREEIYAYGLRNPWRFSFDDGPGGTGRLFAADVGQRLYEEINIIEKGGNYGWRNREGTHPFDPTAPDPGVPFIGPIAEYSHPNAPDGVKIGVSATGGFVYRGDAIPELKGKYVFGDWSRSFGTPSGTLLGLEETSPGTWTLTALEIEGGNPIPYFINSFGVDEFGEMYVLANKLNMPGLDPVTGLPGGVIFRIVPEPVTLAGLLAAGPLVLFRRVRRGKR